MHSLIWAAPARHDLTTIGAWLAEQAGPEIAVRYLEQIIVSSDRFRYYPASGPANGDGVRRMRISGTRYLLFYRITATRVEILRVRHAREN